MSVPEMPWYSAMERGLRPIEPYSSIVLIGIGIICAWVALRGDSVTKTGLMVWLLSP